MKVSRSTPEYTIFIDSKYTICEDEKAEIHFYENKITLNKVSTPHIIKYIPKEHANYFINRHLKELKEAFVEYHNDVFKTITLSCMLTDPRWWVRELAKVDSKMKRLEVINEDFKCTTFHDYSSEFATRSFNFYENRISIHFVKTPHIVKHLPRDAVDTEKFINENSKEFKDALIKFYRTNSKELTTLSMAIDPRWWVRELAKRESSSR